MTCPGKRSKRGAGWRYERAAVSYLGVMAVDPGTETGVAWAVCGASGTIRDRLGSAPSPPKSATLAGPYVGQAYEIFARWVQFIERAEQISNRLGEEIYCSIVFEDYILTRLDSFERHGLDPVRVTSAFCALLGDKWNAVKYQQPGEAMTFATNPRLKQWGLWVKGKDHERAAMKHLVTFLAKDISRNSGSTQKKGKGSSGRLLS